VRIVALASGSSGNAILVDAGETRILVDCGIGPRTLAKALKSVGVAPQSLDAIVVTHEHVDHSRGIVHALTRWPMPVIASPGTVRGLVPAARAQGRPTRTRASVGTLDIDFIPVAHDANEPTALAVTDRASGMRAGIAHDLGVVPRPLVDAFRGVDLLCVEANHDVEMLRTGPYPAHLKARVAGGRGHLSNAQAAAFIDAVSTRDLRAVLLLHLSAVNNTPATACDATRRGVHRRARRASLAAAIRRTPSPPIGEAGWAQMALAI
jgi:phosphoribosyl 1,2-cyclic phosphodiesterase